MRDWEGQADMKWLNQSVHAQTYGVKRGDLSQKFHHPRLKSWGVVMVVGYEFQPQPCLTIQHTNGERLEGLKCCDLTESVQTNSIWVQKVGLGNAKILPIHDQKTGYGDHFRAHTPISTLSNHSLYL